MSPDGGIGGRFAGITWSQPYMVGDGQGPIGGKLDSHV